MSEQPSAESDADRLAALLREHVALGDDDKGIEQCSCGVIAIWRRDSIEDEDDVRYLDTHAEGADLRWHVAHVAAVLVEAGVGFVTQAKAEALRDAADAALLDRDSGWKWVAEAVANWLRARVVTPPGGAL